ncbi:helix-turn-helix transcriptional regulator [Caulobacter sp. KR2-114]|uniref:helix-turn-helix transcriptional regulator n=1 Tax=Caulobacter sp. KR2-114 TaxID=3400912 RepID=UPI003BFBABE5
MRRQVGALVRHHRERLGLTQAELADRTGRSLETIGGVERGRTAPSFETLQDLADALGVAVRDLFGVGDFAAEAGRNDPLVRLIERVSGLNDDDMDWLDRVVASILARKSRA